MHAPADSDLDTPLSVPWQHEAGFAGVWLAVCVTPHHVVWSGIGREVSVLILMLTLTLVGNSYYGFVRLNISQKNCLNSIFELSKLA